MRHLKKYVTVKYTRTKDIYESPSQKAAEGNAFKADLFVSIHRDCFSSDTAKGYSTLVNTDTGMRKTFADYVNAKMEKKIGFRNRGTKLRDDLAVLNQTKMPAVLCEVGFISNKDDNDIRIAPSFATESEIKTAIYILSLCTKIVSIDYLVENKKEKNLC